MGAPRGWRAKEASARAWMSRPGAARQAALWFHALPLIAAGKRARKEGGALVSRAASHFFRPQSSVALWFPGELTKLQARASEVISKSSLGPA